LIAATAALVCSLGIAVTVATADEEPTSEPLNDPGTARELVALMQAGEAQRYVADYEITRERADGATLPTKLTVAHSPRVQITRQDETLRIDLAETSYDCQRVNDEPMCFRVDGGFGIPQSEVLDAAIAAAPYDVLRRGSLMSAGEEAACFELTAQNPFCLASDGIPLRTEVEGVGNERREALAVVRSFDEASLRPLLQGFEKVIPGFGR
jgi:hypothetical protein